MENKIVLITGSTDGIGKQTALELAVRLKRTNVTANCLHPGVIDTKMLRASLGMGGASLVEGAKTSVYLAAAHELEPVTGKFFSDSKESESSNYSHNIETRKKLWELSLTPWHGDPISSSAIKEDD